MGKFACSKDHTFIDLPKDMPREIVRKLSRPFGFKVQLNISVDRARPPGWQPGGKFSKGKAFEKRKKFGKGGKGHKGKQRIQPRLGGFAKKGMRFWRNRPTFENAAFGNLVHRVVGMPVQESCFSASLNSPRSNS